MYLKIYSFFILKYIIHVSLSLPLDSLNRSIDLCLKRVVSLSLLLLLLFQRLLSPIRSFPPATSPPGSIPTPSKPLPTLISLSLSFFLSPSITRSSHPLVPYLWNHHLQLLLLLILSPITLFLVPLSDIIQPLIFLFNRGKTQKVLYTLDKFIY